MLDYEVLKVIWWLFIGVLLAGFAIMDGHRIWVSVPLLPFLGKTTMKKRIMINAAAPLTGTATRFGSLPAAVLFLLHGR